MNNSAEIWNYAAGLYGGKKLNLFNWIFKNVSLTREWHYLHRTHVKTCCFARPKGHKIRAKGGGGEGSGEKREQKTSVLFVAMMCTLVSERERKTEKECKNGKNRPLF